MDSRNVNEFDQSDQFYGYNVDWVLTQGCFHQFHQEGLYQHTLKAAVQILN